MDRPLRLPLALLVATGLLVTGCGGSDDASTASEPAGASGAAPFSDRSAGATSSDDDGAAPAQDGGAGAGGTTDALGVVGTAQGPSTQVDVTVDGSAVVRTAELGVRVDDLRSAADAAGRIVRDAGGSVAAERSDAARGDGGYANAELSLRVPPERFDDVLAQLARLGDERARSLSSDPVGEELIDLESRLATQRASVERVRALLAEATDLGEVVQIEAELTRRTADLESLQARLAGLRERVAMSTVVLRLDTEDEPVQAGPPGFLDGLRGGWSAFLATALAIATVAGAVLPFLPFLALAVWAALRARRRPGQVEATAGP